VRLKDRFLRSISQVGRKRLSSIWTILRQTYIPDFICYDEIKVFSATTGVHKARELNYPRDGIRLGLPVNLGRYPKASAARIVRWNFRAFRAFRGQMRHIS